MSHNSVCSPPPTTNAAAPKKASVVSCGGGESELSAYRRKNQNNYTYLPVSAWATWVYKTHTAILLAVYFQGKWQAVSKPSG